VNVIVNGLQVLSTHRLGNGNLAEDWSKFPKARERLLELVLESGVEAPILVSGDVHMSQVMRDDCVRVGDGKRRSIVEVTTSGLTHSWGTGFSPYPMHRGKWYSAVPNFMSAAMMHTAHRFMPWTELLINNDNAKAGAGAQGEGGTYTPGTPPSPHGVTPGKQYSLSKNYGLFSFDFDADVLVASIKGPGSDPRGPSDTDLLQASWTFGMLSGREDMGGGGVGEGTYSRAHTASSDSSASTTGDDNDDSVGTTWTCEGYGGTPGAWEVVFGYAVGLSVVFFFVAVVPAACVWAVGTGVRRAGRGEVWGGWGRKGELEVGGGGGGGGGVWLERC